MARNNYEDGPSFEKFTHRKTKSKSKGHQSKHNRNDIYWDDLIADDGDDGSSSYKEEYKPYRKDADKKSSLVVQKQPTPTNTTTAPTPFEYGPNTHDFKGFKVDFDRVASVEKIQNDFNGNTTYGIKFVFLGKKALFRVAWYNKDEKLRDRIFDKEYAFWLSVKQKELN